MVWVEVVVAAAVLFAVAAVAAGWGDRLHPAEPEVADPGFPDRPLCADDVAGLRFRRAVRGYRMDDVDTALDRLAERLRELEVEVAARRPYYRPGG